MLDKALPTAKAFYPGYLLPFLFDNATSHSVNVEDALWAKNMNKGIGGKQAQIHDGWYYEYSV